ncbi:acetyltransferase [Bacillus sp. 3255]|uniref:acetyltransferase n=1 Tax=Bacillus sp. 3255 TaxID=2817904 RepID=UPI0028566BC2|nr:acetyltransferase [Bacillus sp. 3255]MDR6878344.1 sugar O-acyltransferase (sialic acid O-acetyltransferase NeuD family) [Bacillus sp. 3255]
MKSKLLIIGASGHGKVVADIALKMNLWDNIAFLDDNDNMESSLGLKVIGRSDDVIKHIDDCDIIVGIGNNATREKIQKKLEAAGASLPVLIHPSAIIGEQVDLASGTVVMAGVIINCCTRIGKGSIINTGSTIDHDNVIKDYVHVSPGVNLAGSVTIGESTWLGIGSKVVNNVVIAKGCKVGAGAVVTKDLTKPGIYVGVPAKMKVDN